MGPAAVLAVGEPQSHPAHNNTCLSPPPAPAMESRSSVYRRVAVDVACTAVLGLVVLLTNLLARPYHRGYFCDDESIRLPYKAKVRVSDATVASVGLIVPALVMLTTELATHGFRTRGDYELFGWRPQLWICRVYGLVGVFVVGAAFSQLMVDTAKYLVGRLRPHFIAVCAPMPAAACTSHDYVTNYTCSGPDADVIEEARLSFPSGHAALAFYAAVYTVMYLQAEMSWSGSTVLKHTIQAGLVMLAWYTALSRVTDHMHHWSDVLAGICIGSLTAVLVGVFVADMRARRRAENGQELTALLSKPSSLYVPSSRPEQSVP